MRATGLPFLSMAMALGICAAARTGASDVHELDPNGAEPLAQQVYRSATRPLGDGAARRRGTAPAATVTVKSELAAVDAEIARVRALETPAKARAEVLAARAQAVRDLLDAKGVIKGDQPELHVVSIRVGGTPPQIRPDPNLPRAQRRRQWTTAGPPAPFVVEVQPTGRPIVLAVCSHVPATWTFRIADRANVRKVIVSGVRGFAPPPVIGLPKDVPVETFPRNAEELNPTLFFTDGPANQSHADAAAKLLKMTGLEIATVTAVGRYADEPLVVGPGNPEWVAQRALTALEPLYRMSIAHELARKREAVRDVRFNAVQPPSSAEVERARAAAPPPPQPQVEVVNGVAVAVVKIGGFAPIGPKPAWTEFTPAGPIEGTGQPLPHRTRVATIDPADSTIYAIAHHDIMRVDPKTGEVTRLELDDKDLPQISWPSGITFDTKRRRLLLSTHGGSGYLYAYDPATRKWSILVDLENVDIGSITYSAAHDCIYALLAIGAGPQMATLLRYSPEGDASQLIQTSRPLLADASHAFPNDIPQLIAVGETLACLPMEPRDFFTRPGVVSGRRLDDKCLLIDPRTGEVTFAGHIEPQVAAAAKLTDAELAESWRGLAAEDAAEAETAANRLASGGKATVAFLRSQLNSSAAADPEQVKRWIADLDHAEFPRRDAATRELRAIGKLAEPALREALAKGASAEATVRLEGLLQDLRPEAMRKPDRDARAMQLLARIGSPDAIELLGELAADPAGTPRTQDAQRALQDFAADE